MTTSNVSSGTASNLTINANDRLNVFSSGSAVDTTVLNGGSLSVYSGGHASGTTISNGGMEVVSAGGSETAAPGATVTVAGGYGGAFGSSGESGGVLALGSGGSLAVSSGGTLDVNGGGGGQYGGLGGAGAALTVSSGTLRVSSGGTLDVNGGGGGRINGLGGTGAGLTVAAGGSLIDGGTLDVSGGGSGTFGGTNGSAAMLSVTSGGVVTVAGGDGGRYGSAGSSGGVLAIDPGTRLAVSAGGTLDITGGGGGAFGGSGGSGGALSVSGSLAVSAGGTLGITGGGGGAFGGGGGGGGALTVAAGVSLVDSGTVDVTGGGSGSFEGTNGSGGALVVAASGSMTVAGGAALDIGPGGAVVDGGTLIVSRDGSLVDSGTLTVTSGGTLELSFDASVQGTPVFSGGGEIIADGYILQGPVVAGGGLEQLMVASYALATRTTVSSGGTEIVSSGGEIAGANIDGGLVDVRAGGLALGVDFLNGGTLEFDGTTLPDNTIYGFAPDDTINLAGIPYDSAGSVDLASGNVLNVSENGNTYTLQLDPNQDFTGEFFHLSDQTGTDITIDATPCYCQGTLILTEHGEVAVEKLTIGDRVVVASGERRPIRWLGHRQLDLTRHADPAAVRPVRILADAFGDGLPHRDLLVSPDHAILCGDVLIPAKCLVNGATVAEENQPHIVYWHVELDSHDLLLAEGLAAESYLDCGNRSAFGNSNGAVDFFPSFEPGAFGRHLTADYCRPYVNAGPALVEARARLGRRAEARGWALRPLEANLRVLVDGRPVEPQVNGSSAIIPLAGGGETVTLVSDSVVPSHTSPERGDGRRLGIMLKEIVVRDPEGRADAIPLHSARLMRGFHAVENSSGGAFRWTNGRATLDVSGLSGPGRPVALCLKIASKTGAHGWHAPHGRPLGESRAAVGT